MSDRHPPEPASASGPDPHGDPPGDVSEEEEEEELLDEGPADGAEATGTELLAARLPRSFSPDPGDEELLEEGGDQDIAPDDRPPGPSRPAARVAKAPPGADDGSLLDEELLTDEPPPASAPARTLAGVEERALLWVDGAAHPLLATLATGLAGAVLAGPLEHLPEGRVRLRLGEASVEAGPQGLAAQVVLGAQRMELVLRLVDGPAPRLVLGQDLLAGRFLLDPGARHLLGTPRSPAA
jgi:hypothetical protein